MNLGVHMLFLMKMREVCLEWIDFPCLIHFVRVVTLKSVSEQVVGLCSGAVMLISSCGVPCK